MGNAAKTKKKRNRMIAELSDKFRCYLESVQCPDHEVEFFEQAYREAYGKRPDVLREDFCGTFAICCEWVKSHKKRTALGVDLCGETLRWGIENNLKALKKKQRARVQLLEQDVRFHNEPPSDVLAAQNFSFWIFKTRAEVVEYFRMARSNLNERGVIVMDMMGGGECYFEDHLEKRKIGKGKSAYQYHWKQVRFNPVTAECRFAISFKFRDGSKMKNAFEYEWRFWTIPEVREMLLEAGFAESHVYFEQEDEDGNDTGTWARCDEAPGHPSWLAYVVGVK